MLPRAKFPGVPAFFCVEEPHHSSRLREERLGEPRTARTCILSELVGPRVRACSEAHNLLQQFYCVARQGRAFACYSLACRLSLVKGDHTTAVVWAKKAYESQTPPTLAIQLRSLHRSSSSATDEIGPVPANIYICCTLPCRNWRKGMMGGVAVGQRNITIV